MSSCQGCLAGRQLASCSVLAAALITALADAENGGGSCLQSLQRPTLSRDAALLQVREAQLQRGAGGQFAPDPQAGDDADVWVNPHIGIVDEEFEVAGCHSRASIDADDPPLYMDTTCAGVNRSSESNLVRCRSGLPFYRLPLQEGQTYLDCFTFCLSKGLDISGVVSTAGETAECRCGASTANAAVWNWSAPPPALQLSNDSKLPQDDPQCTILVSVYTGGLVDSAVPFPLLKLSDDDVAYISRVALGVEHVHEEDAPAVDSASVPDADHTPAPAIDSASEAEADEVYVNASLASIRRGAALLGLGGYCKDHKETGVGNNMQCSSIKQYCSYTNALGTMTKLSCPLSCGLCTANGWLSCYPYSCGPGMPWPKASNGKVYVNYFFEGGLDQARKDAFKKAAAEWSTKTCIQFSYSTQTPRLAISKKNSGTCSCDVGFPGAGKTHTLNMGWCNSMTHVGNVMHEIGHCIGMNHEQNRPDGAQAYYTPAGWKGSYLNVFWNNIGNAWKGQYKGGEKNYIGSKSAGGYVYYDYGSIMHYGKGDPKKPAFSVKNSAFDKVVGQRNGLSSGDVQQTLDMYQCSAPGGSRRRRTATAPSPSPGPSGCSDAAGTSTPFGMTCAQLKGYCTQSKNGPTVQQYCPKTCGKCGSTGSSGCSDAAGTSTPFGLTCAQLKGYCTQSNNGPTVQQYCPWTCGKCR